VECGGWEVIDGTTGLPDERFGTVSSLPMAPDVTATADLQDVAAPALFEYIAALALQPDGAEPMMYFIHSVTHNSVWQLPEGCESHLVDYSAVQELRRSEASLLLAPLPEMAPVHLQYVAAKDESQGGKVFFINRETGASVWELPGPECVVVPDPLEELENNGIEEESQEEEEEEEEEEEVFSSVEMDGILGKGHRQLADIYEDPDEAERLRKQRARRARAEEQGKVRLALEKEQEEEQEGGFSSAEMEEMLGKGHRQLTDLFEDPDEAERLRKQRVRRARLATPEESSEESSMPLAPSAPMSAAVPLPLNHGEPKAAERPDFDAPSLQSVSAAVGEGIWLEHFDEEHACPYFINSVTGESRW
jgi:hypothetical protein